MTKNTDKESDESTSKQKTKEFSRDGGGDDVVAATGGDGKNGNDPSPSSSELPQLPFVTTSDVLNRLNKSLKDLSGPGDGTSQQQAYFELQKRLPDGSTMPASKSDLAYSDLQTKLQQSATFVAQLTSKEDKLIWAEEQRLMGNAYFNRGDYKTALDVYLTCLVVKDTTTTTSDSSSSKKSSENNVGDVDVDDNIASKSSDLDFLKKTLVPVLNNLAQCTLQLGMHKKTVDFCNIALEEIEKEQQQQQRRSASTDSSTTIIDPISFCKIYFKRAKARRLTGGYVTARVDLNTASQFLDEQRQRQQQRNKDDDDSKNSIPSLVPYEKAINKEYQLLDSAEKEGRKNRIRQKRAMQKVLSSSKASASETATSSSSGRSVQRKEFPQQDQEQRSVNAVTSSSSKEATQNVTSTKGLYEDESMKPRQFSTLRARRIDIGNKTDKKVNDEDDDDNDNRQLTYLEYYWLVVAGVAETLLLWMGDEETKAKYKHLYDEDDDDDDDGDNRDDNDTSKNDNKKKVA